MKHEPIPSASDRLKAFDEAVQAEYDALYNDVAYANCDESLNKLFRRFEALKDELTAQCETFLEHGPVGMWPKSGGTFAELDA